VGLVLHVLAVVALLHCGAPGWLKLSLMPLPVASLCRETMLLRGHSERVELRLRGKAAILRIDGVEVDSGPPRSLHCSQWLIVLEFPLRGQAREPVFRLGRRRFRLVLFADSLPGDELRRLRRWVYHESD